MSSSLRRSATTAKSRRSCKSCSYWVTARIAPVFFPSRSTIYCTFVVFRSASLFMMRAAITLARALEPVDHAGDVPGAEAVVDVDHSDVGRATVQHAEKRRQAAETGAIPDAGGHGDHGHAHHAADHARQRALHARDDDDHAGAAQVAALAEQPVDSGHTDVVERLRAIAHRFGSDQGFFRYRDVGSPCRHHQHFALAANLPVAANGDGARKRMELGARVQLPDAFE